MSKRTPIAQRLRELEAQFGEITADNTRGAEILAYIVEGAQKVDADIIALEVGPEDARLRVARAAGESMAALIDRANPAGCWRASPAPIFADHPQGESEGDEALRLILTMKAKHWAGPLLQGAGR